MRKVWDEARVLEARALKASGKEWTEVGELMGVSAASAATAVSRYEVKNGETIVKRRFTSDPTPADLTGRDTDAALITSIGESLWGNHWYASMARALKVNKQTVYDWSSGRYRAREGIYDELETLVNARRKHLEQISKILAKRG